MVTFERRVCAKSNDVAATGRSKSVINLLLCESLVSSSVSNARVGDQEAAKSSVSSVTEAPPVVNVDQAFACSAFDVHPVFTMFLSGLFVFLVAKNASKDDGDSELFVIPVEECLDVSPVSILIPEIGCIGLICSLVRGEC